MEESEEKKIKHIVMSGGGVAGFSFYGALKESNKRGLWNIDDIKSIYGTSAGALFGLIIALKYDWSVVDDYIIKRPWHHIFNFNIQNVFTIFDSRGMYDVKVMEEIYLPLFNGKDISINITMKEFYEVTGIDMHFFAVNINNFTTIEFSHKTHADWRIIDAVYCSCCLPILFQPYINEDKCYSDGGMVCNYPVNYCINNGADPDEIFGLCRKSIIRLNYNVTSESSLFDYMLNIFYKTIERVLNNRVPIDIKREMFIDCPPLAVSDIFNTSSKVEERLRLIQVGIDSYINNFCLKTEELEEK
uniref:PNPLA domain-containing protein n=1 Tax=viral metagenome TaxID=1070528 RepID=A0A6C0B6P8_9ZZZZ